MAITAALVKELRERTGAGMMECKKALTETNGDIEAAIELMRKSGAAKADKKAGRIAAEGLIIIQQSDDARSAAVVEINCETDFVAKNEDFQAFANAVCARVLAADPADLDALLAMPLGDGDATTVEEARKALIAKLGENMNVRRFARIETQGVLGSYLHGTRIGVVVDVAGGDVELARDLAMHVAASRPLCVRPEQVPADEVAKERDVAEAQAAASGKPANIIEKMVEGRIRKYLEEVTLLGQPFVKDPNTKVDALLKGKGAEVAGFIRFEVGEGIEKKTENFAEEVMSQVRGG
ncbi:MAG: translation elongation factor Ts [Gammaproteobacteria bacterium]|nr:translation elongation factor Ts [Gammaproteobacteria bacterium]